MHSSIVPPQKPLIITTSDKLHVGVGSVVASIAAAEVYAVRRHNAREKDKIQLETIIMVRKGLNHGDLTPGEAKFFLNKQNVPDGLIKHTLEYFGTPEQQVQNSIKNQGKNGQLRGGGLRENCTQVSTCTRIPFFVREKRENPLQMACIGEPVGGPSMKFSNISPVQVGLFFFVGTFVIWLGSLYAFRKTKTNEKPFFKNLNESLKSKLEKKVDKQNEIISILEKKVDHQNEIINTMRIEIDTFKQTSLQHTKLLNKIEINQTNTLDLLISMQEKNK